MNTFLPIHIRSNRENSRANLFLLLIPSLVFFLVLAFLIFKIKSLEVATIAQPEILGTEAETLDKTR